MNVYTTTIRITHWCSDAHCSKVDQVRDAAGGLLNLVEGVQVDTGPSERMTEDAYWKMRDPRPLTPAEIVATEKGTVAALRMALEPKKKRGKQGG